MSVGLYIHIPFCLRKCPYCDFYSLTDFSLRERYISACVNEISLLSGTVDSIYLGGGTPSLLTADEVERLLAAADRYLTVTSDCEITLECNPATADLVRMREFRNAGINRLSVGVQRLDDSMLRSLGRLHDTAQALAALRDAVVAFDNVSADLMLGLPYDTLESANKSIKQLSEAGVNHISAYLLKLMEGTPFGEHTPDGIPDDDCQADIYKSAVSCFSMYGFSRYEISNFAQKGYESRHNMRYWDCGEWYGVGAAAHSSQGGRRYSHPRDIKKYIECFSSANVDRIAVSELEGVVDAEEYIMLRLRTDAGLSPAELKKRFGFVLSDGQRKFLASCQTAGLCTCDEKTVRLTTDGMLVSNQFIERLL